MATNVGPLTSFTAAASCATSTAFTQIWTGGGYYYQQGPRASETDCYPSGYTGTRGQYYSPVTACPSGYTPACSSLNSIASLTETAYICCPTVYGYTCVKDAWYPWQSTMGCTSEFNAPWTSAIPVISNGQTLKRTTNETRGGVGAFSIQVRFQASAESAGSGSGPPQPSETGGNNSGGGGGSSGAGLSAGAAAGIGVGAAAGIVAIVGAAFFLLRRRGKANASSSMAGAAGAVSPSGPYGGQAAGGYAFIPPPESISPGYKFHEMGPRSPLYQLYQPQPPTELVTSGFAGQHQQQQEQHETHQQQQQHHVGMQHGSPQVYHAIH